LDGIYRPTEERLAVLETKMENIESQFIIINEKLDSLINLKNKGAGAAWLIGAVFSFSVLIIVNYISSFFKGATH